MTGNLEHKVNTGTASYYVKGATTQKFENIWESRVTGTVLIKSNNDVTIDSDTKITIVTGSSKLEMDKGGNITLSGLNITVTGAKIMATGKELVNISGITRPR